jgi:hypothetical protein
MNYPYIFIVNIYHTYSSENTKLTHLKFCKKLKKSNKLSPKKIILKSLTHQSLSHPLRYFLPQIFRD